MNISKSDILAVVATIFFISYIVYLSEKNKGVPVVDESAVIKFKRDSLEMEWYKRELERSYPFEHSKIPKP